MKKLFFSLLSIFIYCFSAGQIITPVKEIFVCDHDGDGFVSIPFSQLQNYALDVLSEFNESPEIFVTMAHRGVEKIIKLYDNPQVLPVCGDTDGEGGYYDIAINSQKEIFVTRKNGILQKLDTSSCNYQTLGQVHSNGQAVLALSFDHLDHLYEGGWTSQVYRSDPADITNFYLWHDFGIGNASGDFVQIGNFMYIAWTMPDGKDHLLKVTLGDNNNYVSHIDLGKIETGTFGLASEYGRLYGNTVDFLYEINLQTMERTVIVNRTPGSNAYQWWGAAGYHEGLNIQISYHHTQSDAEAGTNPLNDPFTNQTAYEDDFVYIRVHESTQNITYIIPVHLIMGIPPSADNATLTVCRNPETGLAEFNMDDALNQINPNPDVNIRFFNNLQDLQNNQNPLPPLISVSQTTTIFVRTDNNGEQNCYGTAQLSLKVPEANVNYVNFVAFCKGTSAVLSVPDQFISYQWNGLTGEDLNQNLNSNEVTVSQSGNYSVTVTDSNSCIFILPFEAAYGGSPIVTNVTINSSEHSALVQVSPAGNYEYSLDGVFWQNSPVFYGLIPEDYEVQIRNAVGCYSDFFKFSFFIIPNFISPNGDGYNDEFKIRGMAQFPDASIKIFDRYGKIFVNRKISSSAVIWDGKYMGSTVQSGTYWYILDLDQKQKIKGFIIVNN